MRKFITNMINKLNPAQSEIRDEYGQEQSPSSNLLTNRQAYDRIEIVNRGVNLIVDSAAEIRYDIGDKLDYMSSPTRLRVKKLDELFNFRPNPYYNADLLKRNVFTDLILEGDAFIFFDGAYAYHLPASNVTVNIDKKTYIRDYEYENQVFSPGNIIHIRENSGSNVFVGKSRLDSARTSLITLSSMIEYQKNFFDNAAVPGLVLTTPNPLSERVKTRMLAYWTRTYNPKKGGRKPMILDGEFKVEPLSKFSFSELDFNGSIERYEKTILKALGVPPILLDSGNNANITPNLKLFYINTIVPIVSKVIQSFELYYGYDIKPVLQDVLALRPELQDLGNYLTSITNAGIITRNEARAEIRFPESSDEIAGKLILPANIAGSAQDAGVGGRPSNSGANNGK